MNKYKGKTALISGGAEGIGFSIASALGAQGMNIVIGDIDETMLAKAEAKLIESGVNVLSVKLDVISLDDWNNIADKAIERFGAIHMLVNNAGVGSAPGSIEKTSYEDWRWVMDVNLIGVLNGAQSIIPRIKSHAEGGWLINVASMAGMAGVPYAGAYTASKVAVVGMSESWAGELHKDNIRVSVLCPAFVKTRIHLSGRNRQEQYKTEYRAKKPSKPGKPSNEGVAASLVENGIDPDIVGLRVVEALDAGEFYIFTHPSHRAGMQKRFKAIDAAFERAAASPHLQGIHDPEIFGFE